MGRAVAKREELLRNGVREEIGLSYDGYRAQRGVGKWAKLQKECRTGDARAIGE